MIATVLRIAWLSLRRDRVAQAMTFVLPIAFFTVFALVFGQQGRRETRPVRVAVVDQDATDASRAFVRALEEDESLRVLTTARPRGASRSAPEAPLDPARAESLVRDGDVPVAVVLPHGFGEALGRFDTPPTARLLADPSDPIAAQVLQGILQKTVLIAQPDLLPRRGLEMFEKHAGPLTPQQRQVVDQWLARPSPAPGGKQSALSGLIAVERVEVVGEGKDDSLIAFYAAGIGVMFLLFSASAAGGSLIEEVESGTLERLLSSRLGMGRLLAGKWLFVTLIGVLQVAVMFGWGWLVFGLDLLRRFPGFVVMTAATAAAAASFGLVLATACRTRAQLGGISTIVILMMSALGGSMFPRFLMSEKMQRLGLLTFNGWALDGYVKVFWRNAPLLELWPQLLVLTLLAAVFFAVARLLARRWEAA